MAIGTLRSSMRKTYLFSPLLHFLVATFSGVSSLNERPVIGEFLAHKQQQLLF